MQPIVYKEEWHVRAAPMSVAFRDIKIAGIGGRHALLYGK